MRPEQVSIHIKLCSKCVLLLRKKNSTAQLDAQHFFLAYVCRHLTEHKSGGISIQITTSVRVELNLPDGRVNIFSHCHITTYINVATLLGQYMIDGCSFLASDVLHVCLEIFHKKNILLIFRVWACNTLPDARPLSSLIETFRSSFLL